LALLSPRADDAHKGHFGLALVLGGSRGMTGAITLAGTAALRAGAGLVRLAVPDCSLEVVAAAEPSYMTAPLPCDERGRLAAEAREPIEELAKAATVVALGPGLGRSEALDALVAHLYGKLAKPMVLDADALNALAEQPEVLEKPGGERILTPHPGEFTRLVGQHLPEGEREHAAVEMAGRCGIVVVLKSHRTMVTEGKTAWYNRTGNAGLATGGAGDVLTGTVTGLWCQGLAARDAARLAVHVHGLAGDLAAEEKGQVGLIASDLLGFLPEAIAREGIASG
jgi:NAD(P)H-hydrate epimerase